MYALSLWFKMLVSLVVNFDDETTIFTKISVIVIFACVVWLKPSVAVFAVAIVEFLLFLVPCVEEYEG